MEQLASTPSPDGSFGALLQAFRHRAYLSQEELAARAELSERTVRNLEAGRVRSPRTTTVRLLADALELAEPERKSWLAAAREANRQPAQPEPPGAGAPAQVPGLVIVALLTGDAQNASAFAIACQVDKTAELVLVLCCGEGTQPDTSPSRTERAARQVSWWRGPAGPDSDPSHPILSHRTAG